MPDPSCPSESLLGDCRTCGKSNESCSMSVYPCCYDCANIWPSVHEHPADSDQDRRCSTCGWGLHGDICGHCNQPATSDQARLKNQALPDMPCEDCEQGLSSCCLGSETT